VLSLKALLNIQNIMIYNFLTDEDLRLAIKDDMLVQIGVTDSMIVKAESYAISLMKDFIGQRYLLDDCFPKILKYSTTRNYKKALVQTITYTNVLRVEETVNFTPVYNRELDVIINYCFDDVSKKFYKAIADSTNQPLTDVNYWEEFDPRDGLVVSMCTDIALFRLHTRVNPRKIPALRLDMFNQAKEWLTMVNAGDITPDLPKPIYQPSEDIDTPKWGGGANRRNYY
jgi:hypothetical protein